MNAQTKFEVAGMDCPNEAALIRKRLDGMDGVLRIEVDVMRREVVVHHEVAAKTRIVEALETLSLGATEVAPRTAAEDGEPRVAPPSWWRRHGALALAGVAAASAEGASWATGSESSTNIVVIAVVAILLAGRRPAAKAWVALRNRTMSIDVLMVIAVVGAAIVEQWPEAAMVTFLFGVAEAIEGYSLDRARSAIAQLLDLAPQRATVERTGEWIEVPVAVVRVGELVRVRAGERIPLDGEIVAGRSAVDQAPVTGESTPVDKGVGDSVFAGTVNQEGGLDVRVTAPAEGSTIARIARAVGQAQGAKPKIERFVDRFARVYTPVVVALAIAVALGGGLWGTGGFREWVYRALVLLVIACPCALVIATPVTVVSALTGAAKNGLLVKGGKFLEMASRIQIVAVDKTGTVTRGRPVVTDFVAVGGGIDADVLSVAASLNAHSEHPVARAIRAAAKAPIPPAADFQNIVGRGVSGVVEGTPAFVGSHRLAEERGACSPEVEALLERFESQGKSASVVTRGRKPLGVIAVADALKPTSREAVAELARLGVTVVMLTGDNLRTARHIAGGAGIDEVRADLLPEDKLLAIDELAKRGAVAMVGDGINDAPALAKASLGIAMGRAGSQVAIETADVALMHDDLRGVPELVRLGRRTMRILQGNIAFAIGTKVVFFGLALAGLATLWMAVFADLGASLIVVASGLTLLRHGPPGVSATQPLTLKS